jgi:hypothetical protein
MASGLFKQDPQADVGLMDEPDRFDCCGDAAQRIRGADGIEQADIIVGDRYRFADRYAARFIGITDRARRGNDAEDGERVAGTQQMIRQPEQDEARARQRVFMIDQENAHFRQRSRLITIMHRL